MATARARPQAPVGSMQWVFDEQMQAASFIAQEVEDFQFSARNDMEWLNEHMSDVFAKTKLDLTEVYKTPGKLRGKTPRTARKRIELNNRAPLTDVFSSNPQGAPSPANRTPFLRKITGFKVAEDKDETHVGPPAIARLSFGAGKENADLEFHGSTQEDMEVDGSTQEIAPSAPVFQKPEFILSPRPQHTFSPAAFRAPPLPRHESQDAFESADEGVPNIQAQRDILAEAGAQASLPSSTEAADTDVKMIDEPTPLTNASQDLVTRQSNQYSVTVSTAGAMSEVLERVERESPARQDVEMESTESTPSSETSSLRPVMRKKSSLTFAALPAREPLAHGKSMGTRISRTSHVEHPKTAAVSRGSHFGKQTAIKPHVEFEDAREDVSEEETQEETSAAILPYNKTSTQRLQERLAMLGKSSAPRISKSIPSTAAASRSTARATDDMEQVDANQEDNYESWIGPIMKSPEKPAASIMVTAQSPKDQRRRSNRIADSGADEKLKLAYPSLHPPTVATSLQDARKEQATTASVSYLALHAESNAVTSSPSHAKHEGPLSASKAKLFSVLKSAKGIFASSTSASAQAKMNASPSRHQTGPRAVQDEAVPEASANSVLAPQTPALLQPILPTMQKELPKAPPPKRGSDRLKAAALRDAGHAMAREMPIANISPSKGASKQQQLIQDLTEDATNQESDTESRVEHEGSTPAPPPKGQKSLLQRPGELRRPGRPPKDAARKVPPAPVSIKLRGFQAQGINHFGTAGRAQDQEQAGPAVPPKHPTLSKKASTASIQTTSSTQTFRTTATSASTRPKALEAAARKREQDEKAAQRKVEQKREIERRRAAKAEEERRAAQEQRAAEQHAAEAKQQALREAAEVRKAEAIRRNEQLRIQAANARSRQVEEQSFTTGPSNRQALFANQQPPRPVSRMASNAELPRPPVPHVNPAKPPKRQLSAEDDEDGAYRQQNARTGQTELPASKRRRTSEDSFVEAITRPTMAPPLRPSMMRKDTATRPLTAYPSANVQTQSSQMMKSVVTAQHQMQHPKTPHMNDLAKFSTAKIPFAETSSLAQPGPSYSQHQQRLQQQQQHYKTPGTHKPSPQYPNGDSIDLPEIATDSEDSGDDDDFIPPDWANSPALRELLRKQQLVDPTTVFGPIAPLVMEEVFRGNKERQAKFKKRTSSANWNGADKLTDEERRKDQLAREKLEREGGWTFNPTPNK